MNEGALTLSEDAVILYANQCFAKMVQCPLEEVTGSSFCRFLSAEDWATLRVHMKRARKSGSKFQVLLNAGKELKTAVQISIRPLAKNGSSHVAIGMVVTDITEARRSEELLRALSHRVVQVQEAERGRVALELHDRITQLLCAILVRSQTLADKLSSREGSAKREAIKLREMLGKTAEEVERISRNLRPSVLDELGLAAVLQDTSKDFTGRTGVPVKLVGAHLTVRLPASIELTLYRILQEALKNVELHAHAHHVAIRLKKRGNFVHLMIQDDGIGFDPDHLPAKRKKPAFLGLLTMRERASYVGGALKVKTVRRSGTKIEVCIPLPPGGPAAN